MTELSLASALVRSCVDGRVLRDRADIPVGVGVGVGVGIGVSIVFGMRV